MRLVLSSTADLLPAPPALPEEVKHGGPGPHKGTGSPQAAHASGVDLGGVGPDRRRAPRMSLSGTTVLRTKAKQRGDLWDHPMPAGKYTAGDPRNDPGYEAETKRIDAVIQKAVSEGRETHIQHAAEVLRKPNGKIAGVVYTDERMALHDAIVDRVFAEADERGVPKDKKAVMMGGLAGAGKSTYLKQHGADVGLEVDEDGDPTNAVIVNPDEVKNMLLGSVDNPTTWGDFLGPDHPRAGEPLTERVEGLRTGEHAAIVHEESSDIANRIASRAMSEGYNVVFDITVNDAEKTKSKYLIDDPVSGPGALDSGYDVTGVFVDVPMATSLHSAGMRHKQPQDGPPFERQYSGRYVPLDLILTGLPGTGDTDRHGEPARSRNRMAFDSLVTSGAFHEAIRVDRESRTVWREVERGGKVLDEPREEGRLS